MSKMDKEKLTPNTSTEQPPQHDKGTEKLELETDINQQLIEVKEGVEKPNNYGKSFLEYMNDYPETLQKIQSFITAPETLESRSQKIENIWGEFAFGAMDPQLKEKLLKEPALLQNMKTGISLYCSDWLNTVSEQDLKSITSIQSNTILLKASDLLGIFKNLSSFKQQMKAISKVTEGMDIYAHQLAHDPLMNMSVLPAFQSGEGFARLLKKHTTTLPSAQDSQNQASFTEYFSLDNQPPLDVASIIKGVGANYTTTTHELMTKVTTLGPKVLESRNSLQMTFQGLYDQISKVVSLFSGGKSLSDLIGGTWFEGPLNFIASISGFGSLQRYETKQKIKQLTQSCPPEQREAIQHIYDYISHHDTGIPSPMLTAQIDTLATDYLTQANLTRDQILTQLPDETVLKTAINRVLQSDQSFLIHPNILTASGIDNTEQYFGINKQGAIILNSKTLPAYKQLITNKLDEICSFAWNNPKGILNPKLLVGMITKGKKKSDIASYMITGLSFPSLASDLIEYHTLGSPMMKESLVQQNTTDTTIDSSQQQSAEEKIEQDTKNSSQENTQDSRNILEKGDTITRKQAISKYGKTPAVRNFNPGNITDLGFGGYKVDGERFTRFDSPQEGFSALIRKIENIQKGGSKVYSADMSLKEYMHKYAPPHENNTKKYINDIVSSIGHITANTKIKDIDAYALAVAHTKKEDGKSYKMLKDLKVIT